MLIHDGSPTTSEIPCVRLPGINAYNFFETIGGTSVATLDSLHLLGSLSVYLEAETDESPDPETSLEAAFEASNQHANMAALAAYRALIDQNADNPASPNLANAKTYLMNNALESANGRTLLGGFAVFQAADGYQTGLFVTDACLEAGQQAARAADEYFLDPENYYYFDHNADREWLRERLKLAGIRKELPVRKPKLLAENVHRLAQHMLLGYLPGADAAQEYMQLESVDQFTTQTHSHQTQIQRRAVAQVHP